jgi:hypothetical protein
MTSDAIFVGTSSFYEKAHCRCRQLPHNSVARFPLSSQSRPFQVFLSSFLDMRYDN